MSFRNIRFFFEGVKAHLPKRTFLKTAILEVANEEGYEIEDLNIIFCSDDYLLDINKAHLDHDYYTDIITFDNSEEIDSRSKSGELYISIDRVKENASDLGVRYNDELTRVIIHGCLHLFGYQDDTEELKLKMRAREDYFLSKMNNKI